MGRVCCGMGGDEVEPLQKWMEWGQIFVDMGGVGMKFV